MRSAEFEDLNSLAPSTDLIKDFREKRYFFGGSALWWSTDYAPDPRKYLPFGKFREKLVHFGVCNTKHDHILSVEEVMKRDVYLYPETEVPMTVLQLEVGENLLPFLVTARPYHQKEVWFNPVTLFVRDHPLETLPQYLDQGGNLNLPDHFYPHIRGLFVGKRGNHLFWYPINEGYAFDGNENWENFGKPLRDVLAKNGVGFIEVYDAPMVGASLTRVAVWNELMKKKHTHNIPIWPDFSYREVSVKEFLEEYRQSTDDLLLYYPLRLPEFKSTLPLVIATKTNEGNKIRKPVVLGIYADNGQPGFCGSNGIMRIRNREFAETIAHSITEDFQTPIDTVLFTPQMGRPKYERISAK